LVQSVKITFEPTNVIGRKLSKKCEWRRSR